MNDTAVLTPKQELIYNFIRKHIEGKGFPPSIRDICEEFSISSPNGVMCHLKALEKKGFIDRVTKHNNKQRAQARGITIPGVSAGGFSLPLRGVVAAGRAIEAMDTDDRLEFRDLFDKDGLYVVKVRGTSMIDGHIARLCRDSPFRYGRKRREGRGHGGPRDDAQEVLPEAQPDPARTDERHDGADHRGPGEVRRPHSRGPRRRHSQVLKMCI
jgi:hypothetical protein